MDAFTAERPVSGPSHGDLTCPRESAAAPDPAVPGPGGTPQAPRRYRDALRHRDLRVLIAAFLVDQVGSWSYLVVISVYVFDRTHSTLWLSALAVCRWAPGLLLASYGGVLADRYERVTVLVVVRAGQCGADDGDGRVVATGAPVGFVLALAALSAVPLAPYQPAAGALTPDVVGERDLAAANSIFSALQNLVVVLGPGFGGLLLLTGRPVIGVVINAASFAAAAALVSRLRVRSRGGRGSRGRHVAAVDGRVEGLAAQPVAVAVILFSALDSAVYGASTVLYVPLSIRLGTGAKGTATSRRVGARRAARRRPGEPAEQRVPAGAGHHGQYLRAGAAVPDDRPGTRPRWPALLQVVSGVGMVVVDVLALTSLQRDLPGAVLGRVLGVFNTVRC